jgi:RNA recognition motif-containing protein
MERALPDQAPVQSEDALSKLYVGNLPWSTTEEELKNFFSSFGAVESVTIVMDRETGRSRGFAFVEVDSDAVEEIIASADGQELGGRNIRVDKAQERSRPPRRERY